MDYFGMFSRIPVLLTLLLFSMTTTVKASYGQAFTQADARELGSTLQSAKEALMQSHGHILDLAKHGPFAGKGMASSVVSVLSAFEDTTSHIVDLLWLFEAMIDPRDEIFVASVLKNNCRAAPRLADFAVRGINLELANTSAPALVSEAIAARDTIARIGQMASRCA